jgi:Tol biopolymer transport system component
MSFAGWSAANLMVRDLTTGKDRYVTDEGIWDDNEQFAEYSVWSPDSKQIAYVWFKIDRGYQLRIVGLDGSEPRVLYENKQLRRLRPHEWSQDGKSILAVLHYSKGDTRDIVLVSVADGSVKVLKSFESFWPIKMSLAPDGRYLVYDHKASGDIFLLATDGSGATPLVEHPAYDYGPVWAPGGEAIVFVSDRSGTPDAWLLRVTDGKPVGEPTLVKRNIGWMLPMGFTRSGSLYYGLEAGGENVYVATLDPATGKLLSPPTKAIRRFEGFNYLPAWAPDGKYLAYVSARRVLPAVSAGINVLVIRSMETGEEREIVDRLWDPRGLNWSPDGRSILATHGKRGLDLIDVQTGDRTPITRGTVRGMLTAAAWDGKTIFYMHLRKERGEWRTSIVAHDLETGRERKLHRHDEEGEGHGLTISPDSRQLAFTVVRNKLKVMPAAGGEPRELLRLKYPPEEFVWYVGPAWTPDGRYILFVKGKYSPDQPLLYADEPHELWRIPAEGGKPQKLAIDGLSHISIHPDGRRIAFASAPPGHGEGEEIWVMENFLPGF